IYVKANGNDVIRWHVSFEGPIVIDIPANQNLDVRFGISGAQSGRLFTSTDITAIVYRKGPSRFS
ncbi:hypothetical protein, partial [Serratia fonticola]|uniref:hypothetical protein n=1 Tax=Serratia fonticola TaxID=47917 RepID=UPI0019636C78